MNGRNHFGNVSKLGIGYNPADVDDFVAYCQSLYESANTDLGLDKALDVINCAFPLKRGGYNTYKVDQFLDRLALGLIDKIKADKFERFGPTAITDWLAELNGSLQARIDRPRGLRFKPGEKGEPSYDKDQVDKLCDEIGLFLTNNSNKPRGRASRITPSVIAKSRFKLRTGPAKGYDEKSVDAFLAKVTLALHASRI